VKAKQCLPRTLLMAVAGILVVGVALMALATVASRASPAEVGHAVPDSTTVDRLSRLSSDQPPGRLLTLVPTTAQRAAFLAAGLLLSPTTYYTDLPLVTK